MPDKESIRAMVISAVSRSMRSNPAAESINEGLKFDQQGLGLTLSGFRRMMKLLKGEMLQKYKTLKPADFNRRWIRPEKRDLLYKKRISDLYKEVIRTAEQMEQASRVAPSSRKTERTTHKTMPHSMPSSCSIPSFVIEYFLLGRTRQDAIERYTQDGGIVSDVWIEFARNPGKALRVLVAPSPEVSATALGFALHKAISCYRAVWVPNEKRPKPNVSPLENFAAVTVHFDELIRVVLPFTHWWHRKHLSAIRDKAFNHAQQLTQKFRRAILSKLGHTDIKTPQAANPNESVIDRRIAEAAPLAALIGVFQLAEKNFPPLGELCRLDPKDKNFDADFILWVHAHASAIAEAACDELSRQMEQDVLAVKDELKSRNQIQHQNHPDCDSSAVSSIPPEPLELIQRVFLGLVYIGGQSPSFS